MSPGWLLEAVGNGGPRGMVIVRRRATGGGNRTRLMACSGQTIIMNSDARAIRRDATDGGDLWAQRVAEVAAAYRALPPDVRSDLAPLAREVRRLKADLQRIADGVSAGEICVRCGGECCRSGRYHVTVADIVVYLDAGVTPPAPPFNAGFCPYLSVDGCVFPPEYRPFNCITFNCDRIEGLFDPPVLDEFCRTVAALRAVRQSMADLLAGTMRPGILLD